MNVIWICEIGQWPDFTKPLTKLFIISYLCFWSFPQGTHVIIAMAPSMTQRITYTPSLPPKRNQLIARAPMGSVMKCLVYYRTRFWKSKGMGCLFVLFLCLFVCLCIFNVYYRTRFWKSKGMGFFFFFFSFSVCSFVWCNVCFYVLLISCCLCLFWV